MDANEKKVTQRLLKKLTALRMTLVGEERDLLDSIVLTPKSGEGEVEAHSLTPTGPVPTPAPDARLTKSDDGEVEAHSMSTGKADPKLQPKYDPKLQPKYDPKLDNADDVEAHSMATGDPRHDPRALPASDDEVEAHVAVPRGKVPPSSRPVIQIDADGKYTPGG